MTWSNGPGRAISAVRAAVALLAAAALLSILLSGCGGSRAAQSTAASRPLRRLPADYIPMSIGPSAAYRPAPRGAAVRAARPVDGLRCARARGPRFGAHIEMFAHQHVVAIPTGIGIAPPVALNAAARVQGGRCYYPLITTDPTGVMQISDGTRLTLGTLFALWGQPLSHHGAAGFSAPRGHALVAYVGTARWTGDPRTIPLRRHTRIVLEIASHVPPHTSYDFPPGL
jgi:hypothetical protein